MIINKAYKTELSLNNHQIATLERYCDSARRVYNICLARKIDAWKDEEKSLSYYDLSNLMTQYKNMPENFWLKIIPDCVMRFAIKDLDMAYQNFFRKIEQGLDKPGFPKFKSWRTAKKTCRFRSASSRKSIKIENHRIKLPIIGWLNTKEHGYFPDNARILFATVSENATRWYVSVTCEVEIPDPVKSNREPIGVDVGIKDLMVCSDGSRHGNDKPLAKKMKKLKRLNREFARRYLSCPHCGSRSQKIKKGNWAECCECSAKFRPQKSQNALKTLDKIARVHREIGETRKTLTHQATTAVIQKKPSTIVIEDLNVKGMSAKGGAHKRGLNRNLADANMGEIHRQLTYKAEWNGIDIIEAPRYFPSSKTCHECRAVNVDLTIADRTWTCTVCGSVNDRDLNAALNLRDLAIKSTDMSSESYACGESISPEISSEKSGNS